MKCPFCGGSKSKVIDSRVSPDSSYIRRRRKCLICGRRFTTYEKIAITPMKVIKKNGKRELFKKEKLKTSIMKACEKRPVKIKTIEGLVEKITLEMRNRFYVEVPSKEIGEAVMRELYKIDKVSYIRFSSVYKEFSDILDFMKELKEIEKGK